MRDGRNWLRCDGIEERSGVATHNAHVAAAKLPEVTAGGTRRSCTAGQGTAVVVLKAQQHVTVRPGVAPECGQRALGGISASRRCARTRFQALEVFSEDDIHDATDG